MSRGSSARRYVQRSRSEPSLEWESLPIVIDRDRRAFRARAWRWILAGLATFWGVIAFALVRVFG